jgi:pilus assembly protein CpaB
VNPRQRRGVLLMSLSVLASLAVFAVVASFVADVNSQVGERVTVYQAARELPAFSELDDGALEQVEVPRRWASDAALLQPGELDGRRLGVALTPGTVITRDVLVPPSDLSPTEREIALNVDAVTGVAGRVGPGDRVDIYAVFADVPGLPKQARVLVRNVRVVSIGGQQTVAQDFDATGGQRVVLPVTLALEPNDSLAVSYASAFAQEVRLVRLPLGGTERRTGESDAYDAGNLGGTPVPEGVQ